MYVPYFEGLSCPVCSNPFVSDDDIVVCPQCGLPHHRACWKSIGQCFEHAKHGTSQQWSRDNHTPHTAPSSAAASVSDKNVCPKCNAENARYAEFCSRCGHELSADDWHSAPEQTPPVQEYAPYRAPFGGDSYATNEKIDGIASEDLANMVGINMAYYMPRFQRMSQKRSGGWNWAAFLLSPYWLFYRKQYWLGAIYFSILMVAKVVTALIPVDINNPTTLVINYIVAGIWLGMSVLLGIKGNAFYFAHCKKRVRSARQKTPDITATELGARGGVAAGIAVIFVAIEEVVGLLIATIIPTLF